MNCSITLIHEKSGRANPSDKNKCCFVAEPSLCSGRTNFSVEDLIEHIYTLFYISNVTHVCIFLCIRLSFLCILKFQVRKRA